MFKNIFFLETSLHFQNKHHLEEDNGLMQRQMDIRVRFFHENT